MDINKYEVWKMNEIRLTHGYTTRPATMEDLEAAVELMNICFRHSLGVDQVTVDLIATDWSSPGFNLETDTRLVFAPNGQLVGYSELWDSHPHVMFDYWGRVHPEHSGKGIGSWMLNWAEERSRQAIPEAPADTRVVIRVGVLSKDTEAGQFFLESGYQLVRQSLRMVIHLNGSLPPPEWPEGITVRPMQLGKDERMVVQAVRDSFRDHWGFVERPFEEDCQLWMHQIEEDPDFDPSLWFLAMDGDQVAGISLCRPYLPGEEELGWVSTLGVLRPWRRQGLGMALLQHSFAELAKRGRRQIGLGVDAESLTGATRLYEKAGMRSDPNRQYSIYEKVLRPGVDLSTNSVEA